MTLGVRQAFCDGVSNRAELQDKAKNFAAKLKEDIEKVIAAINKEYDTPRFSTSYANGESTPLDGLGQITVNVVLWPGKRNIFEIIVDSESKVVTANRCDGSLLSITYPISSIENDAVIAKSFSDFIAEGLIHYTRKDKIALIHASMEADEPPAPAAA